MMVIRSDAQRHPQVPHPVLRAVCGGSLNPGVCPVQCTDGPLGRRLRLGVFEVPARCHRSAQRMELSPPHPQDPFSGEAGFPSDDAKIPRGLRKLKNKVLEIWAMGCYKWPRILGLFIIC